MSFTELSCKDLKAKLDAKADLCLVDVREPWESQTARIEAAKLIPLGTLAGRLGELPHGKEIVFLCHHGQRSMQACLIASRGGFERLFNLTGGIDAWSTQVDPKVPHY